MRTVQSHPNYKWEQLVKWLSNKPLFRDVYKQGGVDSFPLAQKDILETMADDLDKKAEELAKVKLNDLLSLVDSKSLVTLEKTRGLVFIGGERADENRLNNLKNEALFFMESDLWRLIYETPKELAQRAMFVAGESLDDLKKGRSMLYTLASQKKIIETFLSFEPKK